MFKLNLIKNRTRKLLLRTVNLKDIFNYNSNKQLPKKLNYELEKLNIYNIIKYEKNFNKKRFYSRENDKIINNFIHKLNDITILLKLAVEENNKEVYTEIQSELDIIESVLVNLEFFRLFSRQNDCNNCYLDIQSGSGGIEAQDWTNILFKMYLRWSESHGFKTKIIQESEGEFAGIKSVTVKVIGDYAYGWLRTETGIHRLVRKSPFDSGHRRHTSFSSIFVYPDIHDDKINIEINMSDLRIDVYRASGSGGQHVNRTESAVRITHLPTNIVTQCQSSRSQHKNKEQAIKQLKAKIYELELGKINAKKQELENSKLNISWGRQIRSYILDSSRIKDLRTGFETRNIQAVLNGNLNEFIKASLEAGL